MMTDVSPSILKQQNNAIKVASLDVFDTVITRVVGSPHTLFLLLGKRLAGLSLINCTPEAFARARINAEKLAIKNAGEITLSQIYAELGSALRLTATQCNQLMELECGLHAELIRPVPIVKDYVQTARNQYRRVVFISDMHLPSKFIQMQLAHHGLWLDGDHCYVSCEFGKSKASGELFREVSLCEGVSSEMMLHFGNDLQADVVAPERIGLKVKFFSQGNLNRYEKILESQAWATEGLSSVMAGASRLARLTIPASSPKEEALRDVAAGVVAPVLVGYVLWILQRAQQLGLKRLYFISRDGQILLEIARKIVGKLNICCELRYIYGSRLSWNLPTIESTDEHWIWSPLADFTSVERVLDRFGINPQEVSHSLASVGFKETDWSRKLSLDEVQVLRTLLREGDVRKLIFQKALQKRQVLIKYLEQEKLLDSTNKGVVDLGWAGSMHNALCRVLNGIGITPPVGFYFGIASASDSIERPDLLKAYFYDKRSGIGFFEGWLGIALELFCSADHGTVLSFQEEGGQIYPVLEEKYNQRVIDWGLPIIRKTVECFAENLLLDVSLVNPYADLREASLQVVKSFWFTPDHAEAIAWGSLPWEEHSLISKKTARHYCAESYHWSHILKALLTGTIPLHHRYSWLNGSLALSSPIISSVLKSIPLYKKMTTHLKTELIKFITT